jgi:hypothetical protein
MKQLMTFILLTLFLMIISCEDIRFNRMDNGSLLNEETIFIPGDNTSDNLLDSVTVGGVKAVLGIPGASYFNVPSENRGRVFVQYSSSFSINIVPAASDTIAAWTLTDGRRAGMFRQENQGKMELSSDFPYYNQNLIIVSVTSEDISQQYYVIEMVMQGSDNKDLNSLYIGGVPAVIGVPAVPAPVSYYIDIPPENRGSITVPSHENMSIAVEAAHPGAKVIWRVLTESGENPLYLEGQYYSTGPISFSSTNKMILVEVIAENRTVQYYAFTVAFQPNSDIKTLERLTVDGVQAELGTPMARYDSFSQANRGYAVVSSLKETSIAAMPEDPLADVKWTRAYQNRYGNIYGSVFGNNKLTFEPMPEPGTCLQPIRMNHYGDEFYNLLVVKVIAEDATAMYYVIEISMPGSDAKTIESLRLNGIEAFIGSPSLSYHHFSDMGSVSLASLNDVAVTAVLTSAKASIEWLISKADAASSADEPFLYGHVNKWDWVDGVYTEISPYTTGTVTFTNDYRYLVARVTAENGTVQYYAIKVEPEAPSL